MDFISAGNNFDLTEGLPVRVISYPQHFSDAKRNICSPADSLNNIVIGAIADNLENNGHVVLPFASNFPASYTRKFNIGTHRVIKNPKRISKHIVKPDIVMPGGDFDNSVSCEHTGLKILSQQTGIFYDRMAGTSYSAPLAANLAAKLIRTYPVLKNNIQSVKALLINSAVKPNLGQIFKSAHINDKLLVGKGISDSYNCIYSDENSVTLLLEDKIQPNDLKVYPLHIPEYLQDLQHKNGVIEITATLCYKINPIPEVHISYCPVCISFGFFNNRTINNAESNNIKLKNGISWSEDYYYSTKLLSNCQKINFRLDKPVLSRENNTIKVAVNCKLHKLLNQNQKDSLNSNMPFSIAINIKEIPLKGELSNNLYSEIEAINTLESIVTLEARATLENEA